MKDKCFNFEKLRRTIIYGIPCDLIDKNAVSETGPQNGQTVNIRGEIWKIVTKLDALKHKCINDFNRKLNCPDDKKQPRNEL